MHCIYANVICYYSLVLTRIYRKITIFLFDVTSTSFACFILMKHFFLTSWAWRMFVYLLLIAISTSHLMICTWKHNLFLLFANHEFNSIFYFVWRVSLRYVRKEFNNKEKIWTWKKKHFRCFVYSLVICSFSVERNFQRIFHFLFYISIKFGLCVVIENNFFLFFFYYWIRKGLDIIYIGSELHY